MRCNCQDKNKCPLENKCLSSSIIYVATVTSDAPDYKETKYIGLCEPTFKQRHAVHKTTFKKQEYEHSTTLSSEIWRIKRSGSTPIIWKIINHAKAYSPESHKCNLCLMEKFEIANYPGDNLLNKRTEIIAKCRHRKKHQLMRLGDDT